jgi:hypothetical protein
MSESKRNLKERLGAIMNHKKRTRGVVIVSVILILAAITTAILLGAGNANVSNDTNNGTADKLINDASLYGDDHSGYATWKGGTGNEDPIATTVQADSDTNDSSYESGQSDPNSTSSTNTKTIDTLIDWKLIESEYDTAKSLELRENRKVEVMLDEKTCVVTFEDIIMEGSLYIKLLSVTLEGKEYPYVVHDYDATFLKLATLDSVDASGASVPILLLFFDTHGGGGQGTHDILMLRTDNMKASGLSGGFFNDHVDQDDYTKKTTFSANKDVLITSADGQKLDFTIDFSQDEYLNENYSLLYDERELYKEPHEFGQADQLYEFAIIDWNGEERLLIYQYFWQFDHNSGFGDIVSVVNLQDYPYQLEYQQVELQPEYRDTVTVYRE